MICTYCGNECENICDFCGANTKETRPSFSTMSVVLEDYMKYGVSELKKFHTYDLLILLRLSRQEVAKSYNMLAAMQRLKSEAEVPEEILRFNQEETNILFKHRDVVEGLIRDRLGYVPKVITDKFLSEYKEKMGKGKPLPTKE